MDPIVRVGLTNLFVLLSIMRPSDMPDFQMGTTRSWLKLHPRNIRWVCELWNMVGDLLDSTSISSREPHNVIARGLRFESPPEFLVEGTEQWVISLHQNS